MLQRHMSVERAAPWLVSGVSSVYVILRTRRISMSRASHDSLPRFLLHQSDLLLMLCGSPVIWYAVLRRRSGAGASLPHGRTLRQLHQLRQVFSALLLGIGLLERRIGRGAYADLGLLVRRLHTILREGVQVLSALDQEAMEIDAGPVAMPRMKQARINGHAPVRT